jgi:general secretion pathway protein E
MSFGQLLQERYRLKEEDLGKARSLQKELGGDIGQILVQTGSITEGQLVESLSCYLDIPLFQGVPCEDETLVPYLSERLNYDFLIKNKFVPLKIDHDEKYSTPQRALLLTIRYPTMS